MNDAELTCRKLTDEDVPATAEVLSRAFADNPCYQWMHPRASSRAADLDAFFRRNLLWHRRVDWTWVVTLAGRVVGTSTLEPPNGVPGSLAEGVAHWLVPTVRHQGLRTFLRTLAADREFGQRYRALTGNRPYYHLHAVAVAPELHGRGMGTMLVAMALREYERQSSRDGCPIVVSTQRERNLPLYARVGFVLREHRQMGVRPREPGFHTWFMLRER
ncbi:MAG: GNAT family N-acetyltransferase [Polyangiaceae bacterium]